MTPAEALRDAVEERWPGGLHPADDERLGGQPSFWAVELVDPTVIVDAAYVLRMQQGALEAARLRRATALACSALGETERSEREVPLIRALAAVLHAAP